jgi:DnaJ-class molecular chaperone
MIPEYKDYEVKCNECKNGIVEDWYQCPICGRESIKPYCMDCQIDCDTVECSFCSGSGVIKHNTWEDWMDNRLER